MPEYFSTGEEDFATSSKQGFERALEEYVRDLPAHAELVHYALRTGHRTRPVGCLLACSAVGGDWHAALGAAIGIELIHKSSVIRDDIVDGDEVRSGQPAPHVVYGVPTAIALSDFLWTQGLERIRDQPTVPLADRCLRESTVVLGEMASGQLEDICPSPDRQGPEHRMTVEERKTGSLSELACRLGGIIGGGDTSQLEALGRYGRKLGTAFQILNDVRNLLGVEQSRSRASDLHNRRDTILTAHVRANSTSAIQKLLEEARSGPGTLSSQQVESVRGVLLECGAVEFGEEIAEQTMAEARAELTLLPPSPARDVFEGLARDALLAYAF